MIVLPWDRNADLTFTTTLKLRLFGDTVQTPGNSVRKYRMGRRLVWREVFVEREYQSRQLDGVEEEIPVEADDVVLKTRAVSVAVGDSYNAAAAAPPSSGSSSGLPTAAIVGICVGVGAILLGAALGAGVVIHRRRAATKQREELERQADEAIEASFRKHGGQKK
ncbi:hypothetical protein DFJ74DRAFT_665515 [Hyaloraphidium curvatum]|nr:hypothetical protein DFJ74DRAFT_665515 [Hyaloraphidium curvatum]